MKNLKNLVKAHKEYSQAKTNLEATKLKAIQYFLDSEYSEVNIEGYKLSAKKYKKQKIKESDKLIELRKNLVDIEESIIKDKSKEIYEIQKQIFVLQMKLNGICSNDMLESIQAKIDEEVKRIEGLEGGKYDIACKFNSKSAEEFLDPELVKVYIRKGWNLKKTCGKSISKTQVLKFLLDNKEAKDLEGNWDKLVKQHLAKNQ